MDSETRDDIRVIHKRITKLEDDSECRDQTAVDTLEKIKVAILGNLDGQGEGGLVPRMKRVESELAEIKLRLGQPSTTKESAASFLASLDNSAKTKIILGALFLLLLGLTGGYNALKTVWNLIPK